MCRLVSFLYLLGNSFWFVAVCFQMIEALNVGYDARVYEWEASNRQGPKPRSAAAGSLFQRAAARLLGATVRRCTPVMVVEGGEVSLRMFRRLHSPSNELLIGVHARLGRAGSGGLACPSRSWTGGARSAIRAPLTS